MTEPERDNLYQRIGGAATIDRLVVDFYNRVLSDPELAPFFEASDIDKLRRMQREFFSVALGGPIRYDGQSLSYAHHGRGIRRTHFARFVEHLLASLESCGIDEGDSTRVIARINSYSDDVMGGAGLSG
jgi:hemoglobin